MAVEREVVQDPNAPARGNAPSQQFAVQGIMTPRGAPQVDNSLASAINEIGRVGSVLAQKKHNSDFLQGQMASMAGKTQEEVAATGNRTSMAGFVSLEVGNAVTEWAQAQTAAASTEHYGTDPAQYGKVLSASAADLIAKMGGDEFAQETMAKALAPTMSKLSAAQAAAHMQWTQTETMNAYTTALVNSGQYAAQNYDGAMTNPSGATLSATTGAGDYRAYAAGIIGKLIHTESRGNENAQNPLSSAGGIGQFIDSTWITTLRKYRPDLANGRTNAEILALKKGEGSGVLGRQMAIEYAAEMSRSLAAAGLQVTPGNTYLAYFAGPAGARRVLKGDPNASVDTTMTPVQIAANKSVMYRNGRLITNAELAAWAARKMGNAPIAAENVQHSVLTNPGLPPEMHRTAVVNAMVMSMKSGDGSLFQNAGGMAGLAKLNLSAQQQSLILNAHKAMLHERQNEYSMEYERSRHNLLEQAASGDFTEEQMFEKLREMHSTFGRGDAEQRRVHLEMQAAMDKQMGLSDAAAREAALDVWDDPDLQLELVDVKNDILDGTTTPEEAMKHIMALGEMRGASPEATEKAVSVLMSAYDRVRAAERAEVEDATKRGMEQAATRDRAASLLSRNILGTGTKEEREAGVALIEETLMEDLMGTGMDPEEMKSKASEMMATVLVNNDVVDTRRAAMMRAAMARPVGPNGEPTSEAVEAMAFYLDMKRTAGASPEYLNRMFKGNERTLEMLSTAEEHMVGDANIDFALTQAAEQINSPVTQARVTEQLRLIDNGAYRESVKNLILEQSGLTDTFWNNTMNFFNSNWANEKLDEEGRNRILRDTGMELVIEEETRSAAALYPNASPETVARIVAGQMADRGSIMGSSFVMAPANTSVRAVMGLNSTEQTAPNEAMVRYVEANGEELFGPAVWGDLTERWTALKVMDATGKFFTGSTIGEAARDAGLSRPEFTVELIGENFVIRPASAKYAYDDDLIFDDYDSLPEAAAAVIDAKTIGTWFNQYQLGTLGSDNLLDTLRVDEGSFGATGDW